MTRSEADKRDALDRLERLRNANRGEPLSFEQMRSIGITPKGFKSSEPKQHPHSERPPMTRS